MKRHAKVLAGLVLAAAPAFPGSASAYTCSVAADPLGFGFYQPFDAAPADSAGEVRVSCSLLGLVSLLVSYEISLGTGISGTYETRTLQGPEDSLGYNLYRDSARTQVWGDGTGGTYTVQDGYTLGLLDVTLPYPVYGRLFAGQNVSAGLYADTIVVTVDF